jgi:hypothetical protein
MPLCTLQTKHCNKALPRIVRPKIINEGALSAPDTIKHQNADDTVDCWSCTTSGAGDGQGSTAVINTSAVIHGDVDAFSVATTSLRLPEQLAMIWLRSNELSLNLDKTTY